MHQYSISSWILAVRHSLLLIGHIALAFFSSQLMKDYEYFLPS